jgi:hypothetical protein
VIRALAAAAVLAVLAGAGVARADDVGEAKARFKRGAELYKAKRWREAMEEFQAAYRAKPHGAIHFNVAQCRERLEDWPGALRSYSDYLREVPDASDRPAVRKSIQKIEERLARAGVQALIVYTDPPGAKLSIEGLERGSTPLHVVLQPGGYMLALTLDGYAPWTERVELGAAASKVIDVVLKPVPRAAPAAAAAAPAADLAARPPADGSSPPVPAPATPPAARKRHLGAWIAGGTAVVAAVAGAWFGASARSEARAIDAMAAPDAAAASQHAADARSKARTANALYGVAAGAALTGVTLYYFEARF